MDAVEERDIETVALGALQAELDGSPLIARTAGSFARARAGQPPATTLEDKELERGGLVVHREPQPVEPGQALGQQVALQGLRERPAGVGGGRPLDGVRGLGDQGDQEPAFLRRELAGGGEGGGDHTEGVPGTS